MAVSGQFNIVRAFVAGVDLTGHKFKAVMLSSGNIIVPLAAAGDGADMIGILQDEPESGQVGEVVIFGFSKVVAKEAIAVGNFIMATGSDTAADSGKVLVATEQGTDEAAEMMIGRALQAAAADGNIIEAWITGSVPADRRIAAA